MKYCKKCGAEVHQDAELCPKCGCRLKGSSNPSHEKPATWVGVLCGLFLGLIGLIIGILVYPSGTIARKTFIKGWIWAFVIAAVLSITIYAIYYGAIAAYLYGL